MPRGQRRVASSGADVFSSARLGRALLSRQALLEPVVATDVIRLGGVETFVERLGGLQAQEPASPSIALWTRTVDVPAAALDDAFTQRRIVKATLMRSTLHAVSAADYAALRPAVDSMNQTIRRGDRLRPADADLARLVSAATRFTRQPRTLPALRDHLAGIAGIAGTDGSAGSDGSAALEPDAALWWVRRATPLIHVPQPAEPWSFGRRPLLVDAKAWLPDLDFRDLPSSLIALVRRYLGAFGPATVADMTAWSGVGAGRLRPAIATLDADGELWHGEDERGRVLLDLTGSPRPSADIPAPPRLLPMWDSVLLAHADRTRIMSDTDRARVIARNGDTLPAFLVDGRVAGTWWMEDGEGGPPRIAFDPFRPIDRPVRVALEAEADRLSGAVAPIEPRVYARYRRWRTTG
jgi:DNA glycosylase AlkZ-like